MAEFENEERTEPATPRRRQEAREQGQAALSQEIVASVLVLALLAALCVAGGALAARLGNLMASSVALAGEHGPRELSLAETGGIVSGFAGASLQMLACLLAPLFAIGLFAAFGQVGFQLSPKALAVDVERLSPLRGWQRLFSLRGAVRTGAAAVKISFISAAMGFATWTQLDEMTHLSSMELWPALALVGHVVLRCAGAGLAAVLALALADFGYQRWQYERDLRMTKQQIKEELKHAEGDPHVKARIRRVQREIARSRMMAAVPKATVVVTNPTHYAVALRYERDGNERRGRAPIVVAKGVDFLAERIKSVARENGVALFEDVQLARALHAKVEIGDEIPLELYQAVAGVLAYVYGLDREPAPTG